MKSQLRFLSGKKNRIFRNAIYPRQIPVPKALPDIRCIIHKALLPIEQIGPLQTAHRSRFQKNFVSRLLIAKINRIVIGQRTAGANLKRNHSGLKTERLIDLELKRSLKTVKISTADNQRSDIRSCLP